MINFFSDYDKGNFYLSGLLALFIYIFVFVLFLLYLDSNNAKTFDSSKKATVFKLDVVLADSEVKNKPKMKIEKKTQEKIIKKSTSRSSEQKSDLKSLFANVKTTETKVVKKEVNNVKSSNVSSRFKSKFEREKRTNSDLNVSSMLGQVKAEKRNLSISTSSNHENDPYYSKIYEILAQRWNPILIEDGLEAKVLVIISNDGVFDYKFLKYSTNEKFDTLLKEFLQQQKTLLYPPHNKGSKTNIEVTFKSKG
ncbi:cell division and transport-associated protein TolA [Malaciobacter marinus]|jgi:hypothetical protein|uniref:Cell division and transport-associated protein TolA n=1 Tax=Malaciobacter marinus TaxID=505249 RepID=A0AB36ZXH0_9BACT|nr:energy transducer TonB [Malaciobacter marinus]PPK60838.1 cell division and transport-associated protein TolA [Malaciobacter marinus]